MASFKIRFGRASFYISFVFGHNAIYIITEQVVVYKLLSLNSSLRRRFWNLNDECGSLRLFFVWGCAFGHRASFHGKMLGICQREV